MKLFITASLIILLAAGCKKNTFFVTERTLPEGNALVKMAIFSTTAATINVLVYINGERVSAPQPNFNAAYPGGGSSTSGSTNSDYLIVKPGETNIVLNVPNPGTAITWYKYYEGTAMFEANKRYVLFVTDTGAATTSFAVDMETSTPDSGYSKLIFANGMPNVPSVDVYKGVNATTAPILFSDVKYKASSQYATFAAATDSIFVRPAGAPITSTPIIRRSFAFSSQRIYSAGARGYNGITTGNRAPVVSILYNQ